MSILITQASASQQLLDAVRNDHPAVRDIFIPEHLEHAYVTPSIGGIRVPEPKPRKRWQVDGLILRNLETNGEWDIVAGPYHKLAEVHRESNGYVFHHGAKYLFVRDWDIEYCAGQIVSEEGQIGFEEGVPALPSALVTEGTIERLAAATNRLVEVARFLMASSPDPDDDLDDVYG